MIYPPAKNYKERSEERAETGTEKELEIENINLA